MGAGVGQENQDGIVNFASDDGRFSCCHGAAKTPERLASYEFVSAHIYDDAGLTNTPHTLGIMSQATPSVSMSPMFSHFPADNITDLTSREI